MPQLQGLCTLVPMRHNRDPTQQKEKKKKEEEEMFTIWSKLEREKKKKRVREKEIFTIREMNIWM